VETGHSTASMISAAGIGRIRRSSAAIMPASKVPSGP
jgi:hypothetical protein